MIRVSDGKVVSADVLINMVFERFTNPMAGAVLRLINDAPPAKDVEAVKEGVWLYTEAEGGLKYWLCSNCRDAFWRKNPHDMNRCYRCGAHMTMQR